MRLIDRRAFLELGLATGAGLAATTALPRAAAAARRANIPHAAATNRRKLVVLDMGGGNDGLSMFPPKGGGAISDAYRSLRTRTRIEPEDMLDFGGSDTVGMHKNLARIKAWKPAVVLGVGVTKPDLSHFEMQRRWWSGDQDSNHLSATGFLGRLCDHVGDRSSPAVGISLGYGPSPSLNSARVSTLSMNPYSDGEFPRFWDVDMDSAWKAAWKIMAERQSNESVPFCSARDGAAYARRFSDLAKGLPGQGDGYPNSELGVQLRLAAQMLRQDNGIRIIHIPVFADFDTHDDHRNRHDEILTMIDKAVDAFLKELMDSGHADEVLLATISEFGRRVPDNESNGLDHGAGSFALLLGPVNQGFVGDYPDLTSLDRDDNIVATVHMNDYYATLAEKWFGVPSSEVISGGTPLTGIIDN